MGQESLNFEQSNNFRRSLSIQEMLSKKSDLVQQKELEMRESRESKYDFLEDVPDWENKLKRYQLGELLKEKSKNKKLFFYDSVMAGIEARNINDEYGPGSATYKDSSDGAGRKGFSLIIDRPLRPEFKDILDEEDNLLPSRNSNRLAS